MGGERIFRAPYTVPDRFAGSVLDLTPDTAYEVRLTMKDPDGVARTGRADADGPHARGAEDARPAAACSTSIRSHGKARSRSRTSRA